MTVILTIMFIFAIAILGPHIPYPEPLNQTPTQQYQTNMGGTQNIGGGLEEILNMPWEYKGVDR